VSLSAFRFASESCAFRRALRPCVAHRALTSPSALTFTTCLAPLAQPRGLRLLAVTPALEFNGDLVLSLFDVLCRAGVSLHALSVELDAQLSQNVLLLLVDVF
jgi:hypothetical protein